MKHLLTLTQVIIWLVIDLIILLFSFKWNVFLNKCGYAFKKKNGIVSYANNAEKKYVKTFKDKYKAAFFLK